jgi:hypothetical protein
VGRKEGRSNLRDIGVWDHCNSNSDSYTYVFGDSYANDICLDGTTFFTGSPDFTVKEVEAFEIRD